MAPWILLWLAALSLDAIFGGRKAIGALPSLGDLIERLLIWFQNRLERKNRSRRAHYWRGTLTLALAGTCFALLGNYMNQFAMLNGATVALAAVILAQFLSLKTTWQTVEVDAQKPDAAARRRAVETITNLFSRTLVSGLFWFLVSGFAGLLVLQILVIAETRHEQTQAKSAFLAPFANLNSLINLPGKALAAAFMLLAATLYPNANLRQSFATAAAYFGSPKVWPLALIAGAFSLSLQCLRQNGKIRWIGPKSGTADITSEACRHALIVALVAYAVSIAFLLVLLAGSARG